LLSSLRLRVGRSSSFLSSLLVLSVDEVRRRLGFPESFSSTTLRRFSSAAKRAFTRSNSEVVTVYSARAGSIFEISSCDLEIRSGVWGWRSEEHTSELQSP